jgi:hypothetical protein
LNALVLLIFVICGTNVQKGKNVIAKFLAVQNKLPSSSHVIYRSLLNLRIKRTVAARHDVAAVSVYIHGQLATTSSHVIYRILPNLRSKRPVMAPDLPCVSR